MKHNITITILTPTYNRVHTLPALYNSLKKQNGLFEWLIVDDGSTDCTDRYIKELANNSSFPIRYVKQQNQGKHIALNTGVQHARGSWIFIVDSDDYLTDNAISMLTADIKKYGEQYQLCYRKQYQNHHLVGKKVDGETLVSTATQAGKIFKGDLAYLFETEVMKQYPFPQISFENFVPELYIWNKISDHYEILFFTEKSPYVCEYLDDGYSKNFKKNLKKNPIGFLIFYRDQFKRDNSLLSKAKYLIRIIQCIYYM